MIAETIASQMGGTGRLKLFIGAYDFFSCDDGQALCFKFKGSQKANYIKITLNPMDTYDIQFKKIKDLEADLVGELNGIYCDQLVEIFEEQTGLFLHF